MDMGPVVRLSNTQIQGRLGLRIKRVVNENKKLSLSKIRRKLIEIEPEGAW
jgi:hypothetical protein